MALQRKYIKMLERLKDEPEYKQQVAEKRLLFVTGFLYVFEKAEIKRLKGKFSRRKAIIDYSKIHDVGHFALTKWIQNYEAKGIKGLVPSYGNRKGCSPYTSSILPIIAEILGPDDRVGDVYKKILPICQQLDIKPPSQKTVGRMLEIHGLIASRQKNQQQVVSVNVTLEVDIQAPMTCLYQLCEFVRQCEAIPPEVKNIELKRLETFLSLASRIKPLSISKCLSPAEFKSLIKYKNSLHKNHSAKATAILMISDNATLAEVVKATGRHPATILEWIRLFNTKGLEFVEVKPHHPERDKRLEERRNRIIDIIHTPPSAYGINRATWNYASIAQVYWVKYRDMISTKTVERAVKDSGYTWRHARTVLTSPDPDYKEKISVVLETLRNLKENEAFFFIDEAGPYRVKKYGGKALVARGEKRSLPERQKSKGTVQFIAALEALTNQVMWRFTEGKNALTIITMVEDLRSRYAMRSKLFLTWDSISSHSASRLIYRVNELNQEADLGRGPHIEIVPLPSRAQFLNVIEAVLSGMKKAVIKNSDYRSKEEMECAIAMHFEERNQHFRDNPRRAGNKMWDREAFDLDKLAGGLFRKM